MDNAGSAPPVLRHLGTARLGPYLAAVGHDATRARAPILLVDAFVRSGLK